MKHGCESSTTQYPCFIRVNPWLKFLDFSGSQIPFGYRLTRETQFRIKFIASIFKSGKVERKNHKQLVFYKVTPGNQVSRSLRSQTAVWERGYPFNPCSLQEKLNHFRV